MTTPYSIQGASAQNRVQLIRDIRSKWMKFREGDLMLVTSTDALAAKVAERYGLAIETAQREVEAVLKGRTL